MEIILPVIILGGLGMLFAAGLALASKKLAVKGDPRLEQVMGLLPGANCGACGGAGCFGFAEAVLKGEIDIEACRSSEDEAKSKIAEILGRKVDKKIRQKAVLLCSGGRSAKEKYSYAGINDCWAANMLLGGPKECSFACIGFATCVKACPFNAIHMGADGLPVVDSDKCRSCGKCVPACPKKLFVLVPENNKVYVACSSTENAARKRGYCRSACISCRKCEKLCKQDAIKVVDGVAVIDYEKCTSCLECVSGCPVKVIRTR